jgi:hypothetical protein
MLGNIYLSFRLQKVCKKEKKNGDKCNQKKIRAFQKICK